MLKRINNILKQDEFNREDIITLLSVNSDDERDLILKKAAEVRKIHVGNKLYLRGLIEFSNRCGKNCYYCGIRAANTNVTRYSIEEEEVLKCAETALKNNYGSVVIQAGERNDQEFIDTIDRLVNKVKKMSGGQLRITLSCGEQTRETYQRWYDSGATRYLLRMESSDPELFYWIHPNNAKHSMLKRLEALQDLKDVGYYVGSGSMIGLPGQTHEQLADDLLFLKDFDVDMVGMGPYIEHRDTPMYAFHKELATKEERLNLSLLMIAVLRIMIPDINIATATALDSLNPEGRIKAIKAGANVLMPNLTPVSYREGYFLYDNKPYLTEADNLIDKIENSLELDDFAIEFGEWGDSKHYKTRL